MLMVAGWLEAEPREQHRIGAVFGRIFFFFLIYFILKFNDFWGGYFYILILGLFFVGFFAMWFVGS